MRVIRSGAWEWKPQCYYRRYARLLVLDWGYWQISIRFKGNRT